MWEKWEQRIPVLAKWARDSGLFIAGLLVLHHEVFTVQTAEVYVLGIAAALLGLPLFLRADERKEPK